jgi:hypothetical protein
MPAGMTIKRYFISPERPRRLSAQDALQIARDRAVHDGFDPQLLQQISSEEKGGEIRWYISEPAIGSVLVVEVADASTSSYTWCRSAS